MVPKTGDFLTVFWNIWQQNQLDKSRRKLLFDRLKAIVQQHMPDIIGLNEVLALQTTGKSEVLDFLQTLGYQTFYAPFGPQDDKHVTGSAIACRITPQKIDMHDLGPDRTAAWHGFKGHTVKLVVATLPIAGRTVRVGVNHLAHLVPYNWRAHTVHYRALRDLTAQPEFQQCTIIGGDFNQLRFMPRLTDLAKRYHRATGTWAKPTWRLAGTPLAILQANYDNVLWSKCGQLRLQEFRMLPRYPSDHAPLLARFALPL